MDPACILVTYNHGVVGFGLSRSGIRRYRSPFQPSLAYIEWMTLGMETPAFLILTLCPSKAQLVSSLPSIAPG